MSGQRLFALAAAAISVAYGVVAMGMEDTGGLTSSRVGPATFPLALSVLGTAVALFLALRAPGATPATSPRPAGDRTAALRLVVLCLGYAAALGTLGFTLSTAAFLAAGFFLLGERGGWRLAVVPLTAAALSALTLRLLVGTWLPEPLLRWLGAGS
ncbi:MAG: tripartite tricarboxylate transporter TctB family protein [Thermoanaerobaculia bacterium]|nr:tripartite tricarboxylate transporter TctB family protein [Thermoanaerobaculia bacterium]